MSTFTETLAAARDTGRGRGLAFPVPIDVVQEVAKLVAQHFNVSCFTIFDQKDADMVLVWFSAAGRVDVSTSWTTKEVHYINASLVRLRD